MYQNLFLLEGNEAADVYSRGTLLPTSIDTWQNNIWYVEYRFYFYIRGVRSTWNCISYLTELWKVDIVLLNYAWCRAATWVGHYSSAISGTTVWIIFFCFWINYEFKYYVWTFKFSIILLHLFNSFFAGLMETLPFTRILNCLINPPPTVKLIYAQLKQCVWFF